MTVLNMYLAPYDLDCMIVLFINGVLAAGRMSLASTRQ